jgi:hypothetical protein
MKFIVIYIFLANVVKVEIFRTPCILCQNYTAHDERLASILSYVKLYKRRETAIGWKSEVPSIFSSSEDLSKGKVLPELGSKTKPLSNFRGPKTGPVNLDFLSLRASLRAPLRAVLVQNQALFMLLRDKIRHNQSSSDFNQP